VKSQLAKLLNCYDNKHNFDKFRAKYEETFEKSAYISPSHLKRWYEPCTPTSGTEHVSNWGLY
jgi:hypothetical protein